MDNEVGEQNQGFREWTVRGDREIAHMSVRVWRLEAVKAKDGRVTSYRIMSGRGSDRVSIGLGKVDEETATACRDAANLDAVKVHGSRHEDHLLALAKEEDGTSKIVAFLTADGIQTALDEMPQSYSHMNLSEYFDGVYWPTRSNPAHDMGVDEVTASREKAYWRHKGTKNGEKRGILDGLGEVRMCDLDDPTWYRWLQSQTQLSPRSKAIRQNAYAQLRKLSRMLGHLGKESKPEFARIKGSTKGTKTKEQPLSVEETIALLKVADPMRRAMWGIGIGMGLRPGELVRMRWEDIEWTTKVMLIRGSKTDGSWARVGMTPVAVRELQTYWVQVGCPIGGPCWTIGGRGIEGEPATARTFVSYKKSLATDAKAAGIARKVTPYLLRHSFATIAWNLGLGKDEAIRIMRHVDAKMMDEVYCTPAPEDVAKRLSAFDIAM